MLTKKARTKLRRTPKNFEDEAETTCDLIKRALDEAT